MHKNVRSVYSTRILLAIYLITILWIIVFKLNVTFTNSGSRSVNLIPFHQPMILQGEIDYGEMFLNVLIFIPLGTYLCTLWNKKSILKIILICLLVSLSLELLQYTFRLGALDVTDLITNTLGGILGWLVFKSANYIIKNNEKTHSIINIVGWIGTITIISFLCLLKLNLLPIRYQ